MMDWDEGRIQEAHKLIGRRKFLLAQRSKARAGGTDYACLRDLIDVANAIEAEAPCAAAMRKAVTQALDDSLAGAEHRLRELGVVLESAA